MRQKFLRNEKQISDEIYNTNYCFLRNLRFCFINSNSSNFSAFNLFLFALRIKAAVLKHLSMLAEEGGTHKMSRAITDKHWKRWAFVFQYNKREKASPSDRTGSLIYTSNSSIILCGEYQSQKIVPPLLSKKIQSSSESLGFNISLSLSLSLIVCGPIWASQLCI